MFQLAAEARTFGLDLTPVQQEQFETYFRLLTDWNARFNLTGITGYDDVQIKHFLDSLSAAPILAAAGIDGRRLLDVGSGAGFPGVPLAIVMPLLRVTLLEATGKKVEFLKTLIRELPLQNATAVQARAEDLAHNLDSRELYDFVVARAVAPLRTLLEYTLPLVRVGGLFIAYKAVDAETEARAAKRALDTFGGRLREIRPIQLAQLEDVRRLIVVDKVAPSPHLYPRAGGLAKKQPL